jgi:hypothetical protein
VNIFFLHTDPKRAAQAHADTHVNKMIVESAQLLSTAHRLLDGDERADSLGLYKATHTGHPCTKWVCASQANYDYTWSLLVALLDERRFRWPDKPGHKTGRLVEPLKIPPQRIPSNYWTPPAQAMPPQYQSTNPVVSYRIYYATEKEKLLRYTRRAKPIWIN